MSGIAPVAVLGNCGRGGVDRALLEVFDVATLRDLTEGEASMAKYMIKASYSPQGMKGVMAKGGSARAKAIEQLAAGVGGSLDSVYFTFGADDLIAIVEAPNHEAMAAIAGTVSQTGALSSYETVVLLTPDQIDAAANITLDYSPPGS